MISTWLVGAATAIASFAAPVQGKLTLDEAIRIAETNSFGLQIARSNVEKARQRIEEAKGNAGPRVTADVNYTRFDREGTSNFNGTTITTRPIDSKQAQVSVTMPIDISGTWRAGYNALKAVLEAQRAQLQVQRNDLVLNVKNAYFGVLQTQAQVTVTQDALQRAQEALRNAEAELAQGTTAEVNVIRFRTQVAQAQSEVLVAQNALQSAKFTFNNVLARPIEIPVDLEEVPVEPVALPVADDLVNKAVTERPEVTAFNFQIQSLEGIADAEERGLRPSIQLSAVHSRNLGTVTQGGQRESTTGTIGLSIPIFDSGITRARVKQARQDVEQVKIQLNQFRLGVSLEVRDAVNDFENAQARLAVAQEQVRLAEEVYRVAVVRLRAGEGIQLEVLDAQAELTRARTSLVQARYDFLRALARVERAIGANVARPTTGGGPNEK